MKNIDKISQRLLEISEYNKTNIYDPFSEEENLFFDEGLNEQEEGGTEDAELAKELEALTTPAEGEEVPTADVTPVEQPVEQPVEEPMNATGETEVPVTTEEPVESPEVSDSNEVEVDVSDIVSGVEKTETSVQNVDQKLDDIGNKFNDYIEKLMKTNDALMSKVAELENNMKKELKKRNPTPAEQLMLRSMSSFPYTQKLSDFWDEKENGYYTKKIQNPEEDDENPKEYKLTQKDIDDTFNPTDISKTF